MDVSVSRSTQTRWSTDEGCAALSIRFYLVSVDRAD